MTLNRRILAILLAHVATLSLLTACSLHYQAKPKEEQNFIEKALSDFDAEAFGKDKSYAVVSIIADPQIRQTQGERSLAGMFNAFKKDAGYTQDSSTVLTKTVPVVFKELKRAETFSLLSEKRVLSSADYQQLESDTPRVLWVTQSVAPGYKYFSGNKKLAELARALNVDGVLVLSLQYGFAPSGTTVNGVVSIGSRYAMTTIGVRAVDREGNTVWKTTARGISQELEDQSAVAESINFTKLEPHLVGTTRDATRNLLNDLKEKVGMAAQKEKVGA